MQIFTILLLLSLKSSQLQSNALQTSLVECWDECFDASALTMLDAVGKRRSHSFTSIFDRREVARSPLECAIQSLLHELDQEKNQDRGGDTDVTNDFFVEYWWRDATKVKCLEVHRDVDEALARKVQTPVSLGSSDKVGEQRCPSFGHVFYVAVDNILAPTLVFEEESDRDILQESGPPRSLKRLWSVPARSNRLLRFRGDCLHAVTYPPLKWLHNVPAQCTFPTSKTSESQRRAVLLFNTWKTPPLYPPVGEALVGDEVKDLHWKNQQPKCRAKSLWTQATTVLSNAESAEKEQMTTLSVPLLGDFSRRGCKESSLVSMVDLESAVAALTSNSNVHGLTLNPFVE